VLFWDITQHMVEIRISFRTWNVRSGSFTTAARELARYILDLVGAQEVRWGKGDTVRAGYYIPSIDKETKIINWEQNFCTPQYLQLREQSL
jgi:hypothetical protein